MTHHCQVEGCNILHQQDRTLLQRNLSLWWCLQLNEVDWREAGAKSVGGCSHDGDGRDLSTSHESIGGLVGAATNYMHSNNEQKKCRPVLWCIMHPLHRSLHSKSFSNFLMFMMPTTNKYEDNIPPAQYSGCIFLCNWVICASLSWILESVAKTKLQPFGAADGYYCVHVFGVPIELSN